MGGRVPIPKATADPSPICGWVRDDKEGATAKARRRQDASGTKVNGNSDCYGNGKSRQRQIQKQQQIPHRLRGASVGMTTAQKQVKGSRRPSFAEATAGVPDAGATFGVTTRQNAARCPR